MEPGKGFLSSSGAKKTLRGKKKGKKCLERECQSLGVPRPKKARGKKKK